MLEVMVQWNGTVVESLAFDQERITIGRKAGNDVRIDNLAVSGLHAAVEREGGAYYLVDQGSTNGTWSGPERVTRREIRDRDAFTIGKHQVVFRLSAPGSTLGADAGGGVSMPCATDLDSTRMLETREQRGLREQAEEEARRQQGWKKGVLTVLQGATDRRSYDLTSAYLMIGRDAGASVRLTSWRAPNVAGFVSRNSEGYRLVPPESGSKLRLNGQPVSEAEPLRDGDTIEVQGVALRFSLREY